MSGLKFLSFINSTSIPAFGPAPVSIELVTRAQGQGSEAGIVVRAWAGPFFETLPSSTDDAGVSRATLDVDEIEALVHYFADLIGSRILRGVVSERKLRLQRRRGANA